MPRKFYLNKAPNSKRMPLTDLRPFSRRDKMSQLFNFRKLTLGLLAVAILGLGSAGTARADSAVINTPNAGLSGTPGPYATVNYVLNGSVIDVTVTMGAGFQA